jgi:hypothetical protein
MNFIEKALSNLSATRKRGPRNFAAQNQYRAQWIYYTPPGYRDEPFDVPFSFIINQDGNPYKNNPVQLDDDAPYIVRGFYCPSLLNKGVAELYDANTPSNALSSALVYNAGGWGLGGFSWPVEPELYCQPGALLMIDFQLNNSGGTATISGSFLGIKRRKEC